jgi:toluene monooxygenase system protein D
MTKEDQIIQTEDAGPDAVGPIVRSGEIAEAVIDAIAEDNPGRHVFVVDRGDYIRVHVDHLCVLRKATMEKHLGRDYELYRLEIEMPSFAGRIRTTVNEYTWYHGGIAA